MEVHSETIKWGVVQAICMEFPDVMMYKERPQQRFEYPCFFVRHISVMTNPQMRDRADKNYMLEVRYHTDNKESPNADMDAVGHGLASVLREIKLEDDKPVYAQSLNYQITDGVLICLVEYKIKTKQSAETGDQMKALNETTNIKE